MTSLCLCLVGMIMTQEDAPRIRWEFAEPNEKAEILRKIDAWWEKFKAERGRLELFMKGKEKFDLAAWMTATFRKISPHLMYEFGQTDAGFQLVITPESERHLRPMVRTVLERAPKIEGWKFVAWRQPCSPELALESVKSRVGYEMKGAKVVVTPGQCATISLNYFIPGCKGEDDEAAFEGAFVLTECLLGEETLDRWTGIIQVAPLKAAPKTAIALEQFADAARREIQAILHKRPEKPYYAISADDAEWSAFKGEPEEAEDYTDQMDLITATTMTPHVVQASREGIFHSARFSRSETFAYVKIDMGAPSRKTLDDRAAHGDALDAALRREKQGAVVGGATGLNYGYLELALVDVLKAADTIRKTLRDRKVSKRSWLLFHDADWKGEWVGIWDDAPTPP